MILSENLVLWLRVDSLVQVLIGVQICCPPFQVIEMRRRSVNLLSGRQGAAGVHNATIGAMGDSRMKC